ncbi:MAG: Hsp70 family protein [Nitrospirae bacterium]|nr:Hsp70 family protein [Magnetococcales bacterium]HAT51186.1 heat-shock protein [Alphaproteobacteria bacterium]
MKHTFCGLDFGTTNSTIGIVKERPFLVPLEEDHSYIPSAIFIDEESGDWSFGRAAVEKYMEGHDGRLMTSLKSLLGSSLMSERTLIGHRYYAFEEILEKFLGMIKSSAERSLCHPIHDVVVGRPVHFKNDAPNTDHLAQEMLTRILRTIGFDRIVFMYEPVAAGMVFYAEIPQENHLCLVVDIGGGTSDFSVIQVEPPRGRDASAGFKVLASNGIPIAGNDFDQDISIRLVMPHLGLGSTIKSFSNPAIPFPKHFFYDLSSWRLINRLYNNNTILSLKDLVHVSNDKVRTARLLKVIQERHGHAINKGVEDQKKTLSDAGPSLLNLEYIASDLRIPIGSGEINQAIHNSLAKVVTMAERTMKDAGVHAHQIDQVLFVGGSTKLPLVQESIMSLVPEGKKVIKEAFGSIGLGLTLEAAKRFGSTPALRGGDIR